MSNISKINYIVSKVFERAYERHVDVTADFSLDIQTGRRNLTFSFRENEKRMDTVIDEYDIYLVKDVDAIVNHILEINRILL